MAIADRYSDTITEKAIDYIAYRIAKHIHELEKEEEKNV